MKGHHMTTSNFSNETPTPCPDCGGNCYDYNGTQVCEDCYHRHMEELEKEWQRREQEGEDLEQTFRIRRLV